MKHYKFILNGEVKGLYAKNLFDAVKRIITSYPQTKKETITSLNLKEI